MKILSKSIISLCLISGLILPGVSLASDQHTMVGFIKNYKVMEYDSGAAYLMIDMENDSSSAGTVPACSTRDTRFSISLDSKMIDHVTSIVMTAHISKLKVVLKSPFPGETIQCHGQTQRLALINVKEI